MEPRVLWELTGKTGKPLTCRLHQHAMTEWHLTLLMGAMTFHGETFRHEHHAVAQADLLLSDFIREGWIEAFRG